MIFKKLEVNGFKSFADKTDIEFVPGVTAIVGPNGSGKSNVADAIRWVLGEQSARILRGAKMEDVIFNGTEKRKPQSYCEVSLVFDNSDKYLPVDFTDVIVTRRMYRSGESEYFLNKNSCRLRDISELFRDTGIGKEGYSIIGQGKVADILSNKSDERRAVFEEAAGIVKYKVRKNEAERKLDKTETDLIRLNDIVAELEGRIEPLRDQAGKAKEYLQYRDALKRLEINAFLYQYVNLNQKMETLDANLQGVGDAITDKTGQIEALQQKLDRSNERAGQIQDTLFRTQNEMTDVVASIERDVGANKLLNERVLNLVKENERLNREYQENTAQIAEEKERQKEISARLQSEREAFAAQKAELDREAEALGRDEEVIRVKEQELEQIKEQIIRSLGELADVKAEISRLNALKESIHASFAQIDKRVQTLRDESTGAGEAYETFRGRLDLLNKQHSDLKAQYAEAFLKLKKKEEAIEENERRGQNLKQEKQSVASRLQMLEDMRRDYEGYQYSVKSLLKEAQRNPEIAEKIDGVVAQLIRVPGKFELAVETALGASLQNVVTKDEYDAKFLIRYLQRVNAGRATFMPLNAVTGRVLNANEKAAASTAKGCFGAAVDLIRFDEKYRAIMENLLGRTVVVESIDDGIELSRVCGRTFRIVTLDGSVLNPGGSMTGGSINAKNTGLLSRGREIEDAKQRLNRIDEELNDLVGSAETIGREKGSLTEECDALSGKIRSCELDLARESERADKLRDSVAQYEKQISEARKQREIMEENLAQIETEIEEAQRSNERIETGQSDAQSQIGDRQGEFNLLRLAYNKRREAFTAKQIAGAEKEKDIAAIEAEAARCQETIERLARQSTDMEAAVRDNLAQIDQVRTQSSDADGVLADMNRKKEALRVRIEELDKQRVEQNELSAELEKERRETDAEIDRLSERRHTMEMQRQRAQNDLENMQKNIWDDYELTYQDALELKDEKFEYSGTPSQIQKIRRSIQELGAINVNAIEEYRETNERLTNLTAQKEDLEKSILDLRDVIADLEKGMQKTFREQFALINENFKVIFRDLFNGGTAELRLENGEDVLSSEIAVIAQPPGKKLQSISLLSGGEQALTAIAILLAMLRLKPTPFCVLDEIESALDEANVYNFAEYIKRFSEQTQFIVITHRKPTMELADVLFGISMEEKGVSSLFSMKIGKAG